MASVSTGKSPTHNESSEGFDGDRQEPVVESGEREETTGGADGVAARKPVRGGNRKAVRPANNRHIESKVTLPHSINDKYMREARKQHISKRAMLEYVLCNQDSSVVISPTLKVRLEQLATRLGVPIYRVIDNAIRNGIATLERMS